MHDEVEEEHAVAELFRRLKGPCARLRSRRYLSSCLRALWELLCGREIGADDGYGFLQGVRGVTGGP